MELNGGVLMKDDKIMKIATKRVGKVSSAEASETKVGKYEQNGEVRVAAEGEEKYRKTD
jgi:hypothetical protein